METNLPVDALRIVVGIDFSPESDHAFAAAARLVATRTAELHFAHVVQDRHVKRHFAKDEALLGEAYGALREYVRDLACATGLDLWPGVFSFHVRIGDAADALLQVAADIDADLVVVGARERSGIARVVLGSVASELMSQPHVPVLVARPKSYVGVERTAGLEPAVPGQDMHAPRRDFVFSTERVSWVTERVSHVAGLI